MKACMSAEKSTRLLTLSSKLVNRLLNVKAEMDYFVC